MLDQPLTTTGDVLTNVQTKLWRINQNICAELRPASLLYEATLTGVDSTATSIGFSSGTFNFGLTSTTFDTFFQLSVDELSGSTRDDYEWEHVDWKSWARTKTSSDGDTRPGNSWTYDARNSLFYLSRWPVSTPNWTVYLKYYQLPAAYNASGYPEIAPIHHGVLAYGTVLEFPHYFKGDRQQLFGWYREQFIEARKKLFSDRSGIDAKKMFHSIAIGSKRSRSNIWGING